MIQTLNAVTKHTGGVLFSNSLKISLELSRGWGDGLGTETLAVKT